MHRYRIIGIAAATVALAGTAVAVAHVTRSDPASLSSRAVDEIPAVAASGAAEPFGPPVATSGPSPSTGPSSTNPWAPTGGLAAGNALRPATAAPVPTTATVTGSMARDHHMLRVVSARGNLWGQHELAWVADAGHPVGDAWCTQNFKIGRTPARVRPTMLICWRISAQRSVYTVDVDTVHPPSAQASVAAIDRAWWKLG